MSVDLKVFSLMPDQYQETWLEPITEERNDGRLHVSSIISTLLRDIDPARYGRPPDIGMRWHWELGVGWEGVAIDQITRQNPKLRFDRQVKLRLQGVLGTCDAVDCLERIWEFKFSRFSRNRHTTDEEFNKYHWQMMAYCHMWGTRRACLCICHLDKESVAVRLDEITYTKRQLESNWAMLMRVAARMKKEGVYK